MIAIKLESVCGFPSVRNNFNRFSNVNCFWWYFRKLFIMLQLTFINHTRKSAQTYVVTRKHIRMNGYNYIHNHWMTVFYFLLCTFSSAITQVGVNFDNVPEMFSSSKEQKNTLTFDEKRRNRFKQLLNELRLHFGMVDTIKKK